MTAVKKGWKTITRTHRKNILNALLSLLLAAIMLASFACTPKAGKSGGIQGEDSSSAPKIEGGKAVNLSAGVKANPVQGKAADEAFMSAQADFAVSLFKNSMETGKNALVSPLSVMLALAMTSNGADGETLYEMEKALGGLKIDELNEYLSKYSRELAESEKAEALLANSVWMRSDLANCVSNEFLQKCVDNYGADVFAAPFDQSTADAINAWVKSGTRGMVEKLIDEIGPNVLLYVINTLFFNADWLEKYFPYQMKDGIFNSANGQKRSVTMLNSVESRYLHDENAEGFLKRYEDRRFAFAALLPNEGIDINDYIRELTGERLLGILKSAASSAVNVSMPKFSLDAKLKLKDALKGLGIESAFDRDKANFSKLITGVDGRTYISEVYHGARIEVSENGTRAGAATAVEVNADGAMMPEHTVILDRPFVFMIIDTETNLPLFIGCAADIG